MAPAISHLGNPTPHKRQTEGGEVVGPAEIVPGASVTGLHWQADVAAELKRSGKKIERAFAEEGRESLIVRVLLEERLPPHEVAIKHALTAMAPHAHDGVSWVASEDPKLQHALGVIFGAEHAPKGLSAALQLSLGESETWHDVVAGIPDWHPQALKMKAGVGVIANASFGTAAQPAALNYAALTANSEAPKDTDSVLTGEITTAGGGLIRKQGTFAFTESTGVSTLTVTWTVNGSDVGLPVILAKFGILNKPTSGGTLGIATLLSSTWTAAAVGDNMTLTETLPIT